MMTQFEYIMVMVALILALALAQALRGLAEVVTSRNRYWPHSFWLITIVFLMVQAWWADWSYNAVEEWRFTTYLLVIASPALSFAKVHLLVPSTRSDSFQWRKQFDAVRYWFFGLLIAYILIGIIQGVVLYGTPLMHPYRLFQGLFITIAIAGIATRSQRVHRVLPLLLLAALTISQVLLRMNLGASMVN